MLHAMLEYHDTKANSFQTVKLRKKLEKHIFPSQGPFMEKKVPSDRGCPARKYAKADPEFWCEMAEEAVEKEVWAEY